MINSRTPARSGDAGGVNPERAETYLRMLAEAELRHALTGAAGARPAERVQQAAGVLVEVGALNSDLAEEVVTGVETALVVRARIDDGAPVRKIRRLMRFPATSATLPLPARAARDGFWRVIPVGRTLRFPDPPVNAHLMTLVMTPDRMIVPVTVHTGLGAGPGRLPVGALTAADDRGTSYHVAWGVHGGAGAAWDGLIVVHPAPPPDASWLDLLAGQDERLLRVDLTAAPSGTTATVVVSPDSPGEQLLNGRAEVMLATLARGAPPLGTRMEWDYTEPGLRDIVAALEAAGALSPLSPVPARLAALGRQLGMAGPEAAAEPGTGAAGSGIALPQQWTSVLAYYGRRHRPAPWTGTAALGALLPEVGGVRFAVAGLHGDPESTVLHVVARGLAPLRARPLGLAWSAGFSWWLSDSAGRWHLAVPDGLDDNGTDAALRLALRPPLRRDAAALTLHVTGRGNRVTAALPFAGGPYS
jgi:hypothetical protein